MISILSLETMETELILTSEDTPSMFEILYTFLNEALPSNDCSQLFCNEYGITLVLTLKRIDVTYL